LLVTLASKALVLTFGHIHELYPLHS